MSTNPNEIERTMPVKPTSRTAAATAARLAKKAEREAAAAREAIGRVTTGGDPTRKTSAIRVGEGPGAPPVEAVLGNSRLAEHLVREEETGQPEAQIEVLKDDWGNELDYAATRAENPFDVAVRPWQERFPDFAFYWFHPSVVEKAGMGPYKTAPDVEGLSNKVADSFLGYCPRRVADALRTAEEKRNMQALASTRRDATMPGAELTGFDEQGRPARDRGVTFRRGADGAAQQIV